MNASLVFVASAGLMVFAVLAVLLPPLWRDLSTRGAALLIAAVLPMAAASVYAARGQPGAWDASARAPAPGDNLEAMAEKMLRQFEAGARSSGKVAPPLDLPKP